MNYSKRISSLPGVELFQDINLEKYTTIRLNNKGSIALVSDLNSLKEVIRILLEENMQYHLVGWGANQIIHQTDKVLFIKLKLEFDRNYLSKVRDEYELPASVPLNILTSHAKKFNLSGWEVFTGIPASLGGAIFMNAGTNLGEIGSLVKSVTILTSQLEVKTVETSEESFSYRKNKFLSEGDIILSAKLIHNGIDLSIGQKITNYLDLRKSTQPLTTKNCGCVFKNYDESHRAGQFIDVCGLKGFSLSGLRVSPMHANFIENDGTATSGDFIEMVELLKYQLDLFSGIEFELEAKVY